MDRQRETCALKRQRGGERTDNLGLRTFALHWATVNAETHIGQSEETK